MCPDDLLHVWIWFQELRSAQGSNGFALTPIQWSELDAWCHRTGNDPTAEETDLLMIADRVFRSEVAEKPIATKHGNRKPSNPR